MTPLPPRDWPLIALWAAVIGGPVASILLMIASAWAAEYSGRADRIVDGDTFWVCDAAACTKIRLCGINAPERGEPGYSTATAALTGLLASKDVGTCVQVGKWHALVMVDSRPTN
jgi:endonuclease YncB( thermonuclease family)